MNLVKLFEESGQLIQQVQADLRNYHEKCKLEMDTSIKGGQIMIHILVVDPREFMGTLIELYVPAVPNSVNKALSLIHKAYGR